MPVTVYVSVSRARSRCWRTMSPRTAIGSGCLRSRGAGRVRGAAPSWVAVAARTLARRRHLLKDRDLLSGPASAAGLRQVGGRLVVRGATDGHRAGGWAESALTCRLSQRGRRREEAEDPAEDDGKHELHGGHLQLHAKTRREQGVTVGNISVVGKARGKGGWTLEQRRRPPSTQGPAPRVRARATAHKMQLRG